MIDSQRRNLEGSGNSQRNDREMKMSNTAKEQQSWHGRVSSNYGEGGKRGSHGVQRGPEAMVRVLSVPLSKLGSPSGHLRSL